MAGDRGHTPASPSVARLTSSSIAPPERRRRRRSQAKPPALAETRYDALTLPVFRAYQAARILTVFALQIQGVAVGWQVYSLTGNAMDLGWVGLAQFLPTLVFWPLIGMAVDRFDRRDLLVACWIAIGFATLGLAAFDYSGSHAMPALLACNFAIGLARAFSSPASQSILPELVPGEYYPNALTWSSTVFQLGAIGGPALGGAIFAVLGAAWKVHLVASVCAVAGAIAILRVPRPGPATTAGNRGNVFDGLKFVVSRPEMLAALSIDLVAVLFGGVVALLPIYAHDRLGGGPDTLGWLRAAPAAGAAVCAVWMSRFPVTRRAGAKMLSAVVLFGVATIAFAVSTSLGLSLVALFVAGAADEVSVVIRQCIVQMQTPNEMRGRVSTVNWLFVSVSNELGQFESGLAAAWLGLVPAAIAGGVVAVITAGIAAAAVPKLRNFDRLS